MKRLVNRLDQWLHFHRFEIKTVCFLDERLRGTPKPLLDRERTAHVHPNPHNAGVKYRRHPSHEKQSA